MKAIFTYVKGCRVDEIVEQDYASSGGKLGEASFFNRKESRSCQKMKGVIYWAVTFPYPCQRWDGCLVGM